jgi:hypothetical protein
LFVHPLLARRLGSVVIGFRALEVIASSSQPVVRGEILRREILRARPARAGHFPVKTPPKDRFQPADSPGQIFVQSLHAGFALLSFRRNAGGVRHGSRLIETIEDRPKRC